MIEIYDSVLELVRDGAFPWQRLPRKVRAHLAKRAAENKYLPPLELAKVGELEKLWKTNSVDLRATRTRRKPNDDSKDAVLWEETVLVQPFASDEGALHGRYTAALTVDFRDSPIPRFPARSLAG
jgi:hypothetical protein